jgi:hypothetical protein
MEAHTTWQVGRIKYVEKERVDGKVMEELSGSGGEGVEGEEDAPHQCKVKIVDEDGRYQKEDEREQQRPQQELVQTYTTLFSTTLLR